MWFYVHNIMEIIEIETGCIIIFIMIVRSKKNFIGLFSVLLTKAGLPLKLSARLFNYA